MKLKTKKKLQASVSVLLIIILIPMMVFSGVIVDSSRKNMANALVSGAGDLTVNAALANYDTILKDVYGLFAVSQNYESDQALSETFQKYFETTLTSYGVVPSAEAKDYVEYLLGDFEKLISGVRQYEGDGTEEGGEKIGNLMDMTIPEGGFTITPVKASGLANPEILRTQIVDYMKYRAPINLGLSFLDNVKAFKHIESQNTVVEKQVAAQQSTQDVTQACRTLIDAIRAYDGLIKSINTKGGEKAVKGWLNPGDGKLVEISDLKAEYEQDENKQNVYGDKRIYNSYVNQVDQYENWWGGYNYQKINEYYQIFLANAPDISDCYLKTLPISDKFIGLYKNDQVTPIHTDGCGFTVEGSELWTTAEPENEKEKLDWIEGILNSQISAMGSSSEWYSTAKTYETASEGFVDQAYIDYNYATQKASLEDGKEESAENSYIGFEKFLLNTNDAQVKYEDVQSALREIYKLAKYWEKYDELKGKEITELQDAATEKQNALNTANRKKSAAEQTVQKLHDQAYSLYTNYKQENAPKKEWFDGLINGADRGLKESAEKLFVVCEADYDYSTYVRKFTGTGVPRFMEFFEAFAENAELFGTDEEQTIAKKALAYLSDYQNVSEEERPDFINYNKLTTSDKKNDLAKFLDCLSKCEKKLSAAQKGMKDYSTLVTNAATAQNELTAANKAVKDANDKREEIISDYERCVGYYRNFTHMYQTDLQYYGYYQNAAENKLDELAGKIQAQFDQIHSNITEIVNKLEKIRTDCENVITAIGLYQRNVNNWETANNSYKMDAGSSDSFSETNESDIEKSRTEYNEDSVVKLQLYVETLRAEFQDFLDQLEDKAYFKYGTDGKAKRIIDIKNHTDVCNAVDGSTYTQPVTKADAYDRFPGLYPVQPGGTKSLEVDHLYFLDPVLAITFLGYLNGTFPEEGTKPEIDENAMEALSAKDEEGEDDVQKTENSYKNLKTNLKGNSDKGVEELSGTNGDTSGYGYNYTDKTLDKTNLPSASNPAKEVDTSGFSIDIGDDDKVDAEKSVSSEKGILSKMLEGIGGVAEREIENAYILDYIFENFSYNTCVQDAITESQTYKEAVNKDDIWARKSAADELMKDEDALAYAKTVDGRTEAQGKYPLMMLSNYPKSPNNNYLYGGEIEYILFGNADPAKNVTYMKSSIYAIRFAFDAIFAFTNREIRNETRSVGLAVQAATLGIVPYQLVQIILQLALAAGEAALDLNMMSLGLNVDVVKSEDSWMLSLKSAVTAAGSYIAGKAADMAEKGIKKAATAMQDMVNAGADELVGAITDLTGDIEGSAKAAMQQCADQMFNIVQNEVEARLNQLLLLPEDQEVEELKRTVNGLFDGLEQAIIDKINNEVTGEIAQKVKEKLGIEGKIRQIVNKVKSEVKGEIDKLPTKEKVISAVTGKINSFKSTLIGATTEAMGSLTGTINSLATEAIADVKSELNGYISEASVELSEEASEAIKKKVTDATNRFAAEFIGDKDFFSQSSGGSVSDSLATMISFGYKEYLMLFVFIGLNTSSANGIISRIGDCIELNLQNAGENASFHHKKGADFKLSESCTYIKVDAKVDLDMLFMKMDLFRNFVEDSDEEDGEAPQDATDDNVFGGRIEYHGLMGY